MTATDVINETRAYIVENFLYMQRDACLRDDDLLVRERIIDSMGVMELVHFIEDTFSVQVADDEITEENIGSLAAIGRFVAQKRVATMRLPASEAMEPVRA